jgi:hypothetical protein
MGENKDIDDPALALLASRFRTPSGGRTRVASLESDPHHPPGLQVPHPAVLLTILLKKPSQDKNDDTRKQ